MLLTPNAAPTRAYAQLQLYPTLGQIQLGPNPNIFADVFYVCVVGATLPPPHLNARHRRLGS